MASGTRTTRGFFDGDGCISWANKEHTWPTASCVGTEEFLKDLKLYIPEELRTVNIHKTSASDVVYTLGWSCRKARIFLDFIYNNCNVALNRKFNIYSSIFSKENNEKSGNIDEHPESQENVEITEESKESSVL